MNLLCCVFHNEILYDDYLYYLSYVYRYVHIV